MKVSIIIPVFNEEKVIEVCLKSLLSQTYKDIEIIVIDDGSSDNTLNVITKFPVTNSQLQIFKQDHLGAGAARNLGAKNATGEILIFVDSDMTFDKKFVEMLVKPILSNKAIGTFSKYEYVSNKNNVWSKCWNINKGLPANKMHYDNFPDQQPVFRAILKKEFNKVGGFDLVGYIDDHTLSKKLEVMAISAPGAIFYHHNPDTLSEVYKQARWIGKSEFKNRKIKNETIMKIVSIIRYSLPFTIIKGVINAIKYQIPEYLIFKFVFDTAIEISLIRSFFGEQKYK